MEKTSGKVTKDAKRVEAERKGREKYMNKLEESILNDAKKGGDTTNASNETTNASNETTSATNTATRPNDITPMALVYLRSLPLVYVYFLHITLFNPKIKNKSMKKRINHQNDVICFRKIYTVNE